MKLEGLRVIDLSMFLPGPAVTVMMADHGAEVIKVENPAHPEPGRSTEIYPWTQGGSTVMFRGTHRGKKSLTLNLKDADAKAALLRLVATADVFLESFRPGVMARLGLDAPTLRALNPRLVYCSLSAFGQTGPLRDRPAHDTAAVAAAGILSISRSPEGPMQAAPPALLGLPFSDVLASHLAFGGIVMALYRREKTGLGDYLDVSMFEAMLNASPNVMGPVFGGDRAPDPREERTLGGSAMFNVYETADGRHIVIGGSERKFVEALFSGLGRPEFVAAVAGTPGGAAHAPAIAFLRDEFRRRTRAEWEQWFVGRDICWMPVYDLHEAWSQPAVREREMRLTDAEGNDHIGIPLKYDDEPGRVDARLAACGEHTAEILAGLGYDAHEIAALRGRGAI